ncbi:MAG: hypothetical protein NT012_02690 [Candidatus Nealsonbacteria bacterium]|nr:hypothetical protein [Candidatus Nealsonbacteria bacterium]
MLLLKSNWFFIIFLLTSAVFILWLFYIFGHQIFIETINEFFPWDGWNTVSAIALIITAIAIGCQAYYTRKYMEFAVTPKVFFTIRSIARLELEEKFKEIINFSEREKLIKEELNKKSIDEKLQAYFFVKNNSKFPVLFRVKIDYKDEGRIIKHVNHYWGNPLHIYPGLMRYPGVIVLKDVIGPDKDYKGKTIIAHIMYTYSPRFAPRINYGTFSEPWCFDLEEFRWSGPEGIKEENLNIFKRE